MAYGGTNNRNYNNGGNRKPYNNNRDRDQAPRKPKKQTFTFSLTNVYTVPDRQYGTAEVDKNVVDSKLQYLQDQGIFSLLTTNVNISNQLLHGEDARKGNSTVGFIESVDIANGEVNVSVYGTSVEAMTKLTNNTTLIVEPRIIAYNGEFRCFNGFFLKEANV